LGLFIVGSNYSLNMAYWNHFAEDTRTKVMFKDLAVGDKFRVGK